MKTDLAKTLSISGQGGLFTYLAQARNGAVVESLATKQRSIVSIRSKLTSLADISIYTNDGELKLKEVFQKLSEALAGQKAPDSKSDANTLKALFEKAVPDYDKDRFYVSHMKKVVDWYNCLLENASLDFVEEEEAEAETTEE